MISEKRLCRKVEELRKKYEDRLPKTLEQEEYNMLSEKIYSLLEGYKVHIMAFCKLGGKVDSSLRLYRPAHDCDKAYCIDRCLEGMNRHLRETVNLIDESLKLANLSETDRKHEINRIANSRYISAY